MFKMGDIIKTGNGYTTAIVVSVKPSSIYPKECFGKVIPLYNRFPTGIYETGMFGLDWELLSPAQYLITLPEAVEALDECLYHRRIDNLTYVEILDTLKQYAK